VCGLELASMALLSFVRCRRCSAGKLLVLYLRPTLNWQKTRYYLEETQHRRRRAAGAGDPAARWQPAAAPANYSTRSWAGAAGGGRG